MKRVLFRKLIRLLVLPGRSLRAKFITLIVIVQLSVMALVTFVIERRQEQTILDESRKRAVSLAINLTALSEGFILSYNFVKLEQTVEKVSAEEDVAYAIVHLHSGKVAAYSGRSEMQGQVLADPISQRALRATKLLVQTVTTAELHGEGYDVAVPIFAPGGTRKWGTVRIGFSLAHARHEIRKTSQKLFFLGIVAVLLATLVAIFLALRISRPIQQLIVGVNEVGKGNYDHAIVVATRDEVGHLARRFEEMRQALRLHITSLAEEKQRLEHANTTIKETQQDLIQSEKLAAVGKLSAKIAHEVNNPLATIKLSIHLMNKQISSDDPHKENLDIIEEEIARIARIIRQLLDSSRPKTDVSTLQINEVVRKLMKFVEEDLNSGGIESQLHLAAELPPIRMSLDQLKQVLLNLIKNARQAMPTGGTLLLQTAQQHGGVSLSVADTGTGIPEKNLSSLFEPFFSTKEESEGLGLGLAVSDSIIKSYGGSIEVESQLGKGTTFCIFLPTYPPSMVGDSGQEEANSSGRKEQHV
ncbi:MAG: ATP-binding protein [Candidatus Tectomicrobia bacterium]